MLVDEGSGGRQVFRRKRPSSQTNRRNFGYMQCMMAQLTRKNVKGLQVKRLSWASGNLLQLLTLGFFQFVMKMWICDHFTPLSLVELGWIDRLNSQSQTVVNRILVINGNRVKMPLNIFKHNLRISNIKTWNDTYIYIYYSSAVHPEKCFPTEGFGYHLARWNSTAWA